MTTSQSSSEAVGEAPSPPVVPDPVVPVIPSQCLAGHPRVHRPDKRGRNHLDPDHLVWSIAPVGQLTSRIVDVPINTATERGLRGRPNIYTVTRPRVWRCADCARERREFVAAMTRQYGAHRGDWTPAAREIFAEMTSRIHFAVPLPRVARGKDQMRHITEEAIAWIAAQRERGASLSRIATAVGVSRSEVSRISTQERAKQKAPRAR